MKTKSILIANLLCNNFLCLTFFYITSIEANVFFNLVNSFNSRGPQWPSG